MLTFKVSDKVRLKSEVEPFHNIKHDTALTIIEIQETIPTYLTTEAKKLPYHVRFAEVPPSWPNEPHLGTFYWVGWFEPSP